MGMALGFDCCEAGCIVTGGAVFPNTSMFTTSLSLGLQYVFFDVTNSLDFVLPGVPPPLGGGFITSSARVLTFKEIDGSGNLVFERPNIAKTEAGDNVDMTLVLEGVGTPAKLFLGPSFSTCIRHHKPLTITITSPAIGGTRVFTFIETIFSDIEGFGGDWISDGKTCPAFISYDSFVTPRIYRLGSSPTIDAVQSGVAAGSGNTGFDCSQLNGTFRLNLTAESFVRDGWISGAFYEFFGTGDQPNFIEFSWVNTRMDTFTAGSTDRCSPDPLQGTRFNPLDLFASPLLLLDNVEFCNPALTFVSGAPNKNTYFTNTWADLIFNDFEGTCDGTGQCDFSSAAFSIIDGG